MKIYDCFVFFNELDLLELRLETYYDYVDYFVICECSKTQQGNEKPFYFEENKSRYSKYSDKIIYINADTPPKLKSKNDWAIEFYQRNQIVQGLKNCEKEDLVIISDIDEFYDYSIIGKIKNNTSDYYQVTRDSIFIGRKQSLLLLLKNPLKYFKLKKSNLYNALQISPIALQQDFSYYFINYIWQNSYWHGTIFSFYKNITTPQDLRNKRNALPYIKKIDKPIGWHFSYLGGREQIKKKLASIIEGINFQTEKDMDLYIDDCLKKRKDLFGRDNERTYSKFSELFSKTDAFGSSQLMLLKIEDVGFPKIELIKQKFPAFIYIN